MFFLLLGAKNAWRNLGRSSIAVISMALACSFLTYSVSLGRGYNAGLYTGHRSISGGEISVYATLFDIGGYDSNSPVQFRKLNSSPLTDLAMFQPECFDSGFLTLRDHQAQFSATLISDLAEHPSVKAVYPRYQFPALRYRAYTIADGSIERVLTEVSLRGRDLSLDALQHSVPETLLTDGRWFNSIDEGQLVCILSQHQRMLPGYAYAPQVGQKLNLQLPRVTMNSNGDYLFDFLNTKDVGLEIIGLVEVPSRTLMWSSLNNRQQNTFTETLYWTFDDVQVPLGTWKKLWEMAGGIEYSAQQINLVLDDVTYIEDTLDQLRALYPQYTMHSVAAQVERSKLAMQWETQPLRAPADTYAIIESDDRGGIQEDLRLPVGISLFMTAALVIAANLLIMVSERKREIAVLKAVGTLRMQIMAMVLSEALIIATLGGVIGFSVIRVQTTLNQMAGSVSFLTLLGSLAKDLLLMLAASGVTSLLFGLLPALRMANLTVMEVLQHD